MKSKKYKPKPQYKILAVYWWNPFLWLYLFICILIIGPLQGLCDALKMVYDDMKDWDLT